MTDGEGVPIGLSVGLSAFVVFVHLAAYNGIQLLREEVALTVLVGLIVFWTIVVNGSMITKAIDRRLSE